jgi:hypothetical protein
MKRTLALVAVAAALAGCGSGAAKPTAAPTTTRATSTSAKPTAQPGPAAFVAFAHAASFGTKDFSSATDDQLLKVGNAACTGFSDQSLSYGSVVQGFTESKAKVTTSEAEALVREAVVNLCPQFKSQLP